MSELKPIGVVETGWSGRDTAPKQGVESETVFTIRIDSAFSDGLAGLAPGRRVWILLWFDRADRSRLAVHPRGDRSRPLTGVFNTRSPNRPNPIALDQGLIVGLEGNVVSVRGLDAIEGTPVLDIKPFVRELDCPD